MGRDRPSWVCGRIHPYLFAAQFISIYQAHRNKELVAVSDRSEGPLYEVADRFGIAGQYSSYDVMLPDPDIDAIYITAPIASHADNTIAALNACTHVACTVPTATTVEDHARVVASQETPGKHAPFRADQYYQLRDWYSSSALVLSYFGKVAQIGHDQLGISRAIEKLTRLRARQEEHPRYRKGVCDQPLGSACFDHHLIHLVSANPPAT